MKFEISVEETLARVVEVEAESEFEALLKVAKSYDNEEIVLDASDYKEVDFVPYRQL